MKTALFRKLRLRLFLPTTIICTAVFASLAFTTSPTHETKLAGVGSQATEHSGSQLTLLLNDATPAHIRFLDGVPETVMAMSGTTAQQPTWQTVATLSGPGVDGSNLLKLYDADSPLRPATATVNNVAIAGGAPARNGDWRASIDNEGQVWMWVESNDDDTKDDDIVNSHPQHAQLHTLPAISTLALGGNHAVALTQTGEVWVWEMRMGNATSGAAPPANATPSQSVKLQGLPVITSIGAWREYGFAKSDDGTLWLWQGIENKYAALTDEELAAAIGILTGKTSTTPATTTPVTPITPQTKILLRGAMLQAAPAPTLTVTDGLRLWLKADTGIVADATGKISQWQDQSGKGNHATQVTAARQPKQNTAANGLPTVSFTAATTQYLTLPNVMAGATSGEIFVVAKAASSKPTTTRSLWRWGTESTGSYYPYTNGTLYDSFGSNAIKTMGAPTADPTQWHIYNVRSAPGEWMARFNGIAQYKTTSNTVGFVAAPTLGMGSSYYYDGDIAELLVFDRTLSETERSQIENYLASHCQLADASPMIPANAQAKTLDATQANLSWQAEVKPWTTFEIQRSTNGGPFVTIAETPSLSYLDTGLAASTINRYRVRAHTVAADSGWSNEATATTTTQTLAPFPVDALRLWLKADALPLGTASALRDLSGKTNTIISPTPANAPQIIQDGQNRQAIHFTATSSQSYMLSNVMAGATNGEIFIVTKAANAKPATARSLWRWGTESTGSYYPYTNGTLYDSFGSNAIKTFSVSTADLTQWHIYNASSAPGTWTARLNGETIFSTTSNTVGFLTAPNLGTGNSYYYDGDIAEVIVFDRTLTVAERNLLGRYLYAQSQPPAITLPTTPQPLQAQNSGSGEAWVTWPVSTNQMPSADYVLERKGTDNQWREIATLSQDRSTYLDRDLAPGTYAYRLKSRSWAGDAAYSNTPVVTIATAAPASVPTTGLRLWLRADLGVTTDGTGAVQQWTDLSERSNNATQATAASRPVLATAPTADAHPVIRFTRGTQQQLTLPTTLMTGATAGDAFVVLRSAAKTSSNNGLWRIGTAAGYYPNSSTAFTDGFGSNISRDLGTPQVDVTQRHLLEVTTTSDQWLARLNGLSQVRTDTNTVTWNSTPLLGHNGSYTLDGDIEEVLIYDRALTDTEREQVRIHLNARHSLVSNAPAAPTGINLRAGVQGGVDLSWSAPDSAPIAWREYILERSADGGAYVEIARTIWLNYTDTDALPGHSYTFRIKGRNWFGESSYATSTTLALNANAALPALPAASNLRLWLRADLGIVTTTNGGILRWQDQSGRGNHTEQTIAANRPALAADSTSHAPVVRFTAAQKQSLNFLDVMRSATAAEIIVRVKTSAATYITDNGLWKWSTYGAAYPTKTNTLTDGTASNTTQLQGAPISPVNQWRTYTISAAAGQWISRLDGLEQYRAAANTVSFNSAPQLGTNGSTWFDGDIAEILIYDKALTDTEREQLSRYLDARTNSGDITPPTAPTGLNATAESTTTIAVRWTPPANDDDSLTYILERRTGAVGTFEEILRTTNGYATRSDYTDRALTPGTAYAYRLKSRNNTGLESVYSAIATATTPTAAAPDSTWPADIAPTNLRLWLRADLGLVQNHDGRLITWEDQSGKNNHATQSLVANQPGVSAGAVTFDATQSQVLTLPTTLFTTATSGEVFVVLKNTAAAPAAARGLWQFGPSTSYYPQTTGEITESFGTNTARALGQPVTSTTSWHLYNITATPGQWTARINGLEQYRDATANTVSFNTSAPKLGQGSAYFSGQIAEVIAFDRALTAAERERIAGYFTGRYATLPVSQTLPAVPTNLTATADNPASAYIHWTLPASTSAGVTYTLERRTGGSGDFAAMLTFAQGNATLRDNTDTTIEAGQTYTYRFRARDYLGKETIGAETATVIIPTAAAPGTLTQTAGLRLWLRADRCLAITSEGRVSAWQDQSGHNNNGTQTTPANQPLTAASAADGTPVVLFDGAKNQNLALPTALTAGLTTGEAYVILKSNRASGATRGLWRLGYSSYSYYPNSDGTLWDDAGASNYRQQGAPKADITRKHLYRITSKAGEWTATLNDFEQYRTATNTPYWNTAPLLGSNGSTGFEGEISEVLIYDHILTDTERASVRQYLDQRHTLGITVVAPPPASLAARETPPVGVELNWTSDQLNIDATQVIERRVGNGAFSTLTTLPKIDRAYTDTTAQANQTYTYRVKTNAVTTGDSAWSNEATVTLTTTPTPATFASGMRLWLRAGQGLVTAGAGSITKWTDQSGKANHATQTNLAYAATANDDGTAHFDATRSQQLSLPAALMTGVTSGDIFVILKANTAAPASMRGLWRMGYSSYSYYPSTNGTLSDDAGTKTSRSLGTPLADLTQWHLYNVSSTPDEWTARLNTLVQARFTTNTVQWATTPTLGFSSNYYFDGDIAELIAYDYALTNTERAAVENYLAAKYRLAGPNALPAPSDFAVQPLAATQASLSWNDTPASWTWYEVERKTATGTYAKIADVHGLSCLDTTLAPDGTYTYRVRTRSATAVSEWSQEITLTTASSSDDTAALPTASLRLWLKADTLVPGALNTVGTWSDQSPNNNNATAPTLATAPILGRDTAGRPLAHFDAAKSQQLALPAALMGNTTEGELFVLLKTTTATPASVRGLWRMGYSSYSYFPSTNGTLTDDAGTSTSRTLGAPLTDITSWHIYNVSSKPSEWIARLNGTEQLRATTNTVKWSTAPLLGFNGSYYFDGDIAEVLAFDHVLTAAERDTVNNYLAGRHRLAGQDNVLSAPASLDAITINSTQTSLQWNAALSPWITYELQRKTTGAEYVTIAGNLGGLSHLDSNLAPGVTCTYRLRARSATAASAWSNEVTVATPVDGTAALPVSSLRLWLKADALATGTLNGWPDQSGLRNNAIAPALAARPIVTTDTTTNRNTVHFDASKAQYLNLPDLMAGTTEGETFVLLKTTVAKPATTRGLWRMGYSSYSYYPNTNATLTDDTGTSTSRALGTPLTDITSWHIYNISSKTGEWVARLNGIEQLRATTNTVKWSTAPLLGFNGSYYFDGDIAEVLAFDHVLTTAERASVQTYLQARQTPASPPVAPSPPGNVSATPTAWSNINLTWTASPTTGATYELERRTGAASTYAKIADIASGAITYTDNNLSEQTAYTYRLRAKLGTQYSTYTAEVTATTPAKPLPPPAIPANPTIGSVTGTSVTLTWSGPTDASISYEIERSTDGTAFAKITTVTGALTYTDTGLAPGTTYYYRILARNNGGASAYTAALNATTTPQPQPPAAPTALAANATGTSTISLAWTATPTTGATHQLERKTGAGAFAKIADIAAGATTYADTGLTAATTYTYRLRAAKDGLFSVYTTEASATTATPPPPPPAVPSNPTLGSVTGTSITLTWSGPTDASITYEVERSTDGTTYTQITTVTGALTYTDIGLTPGGTYYYRILARNSSGASAYTTALTATTTPPPQPPAAPSELAASATSTSTIALTWTASPTSSATYQLERKTGAGVFAKIADIAASAVTYTDTALTAATTYTYRLRVVKDGVFSTYTAEVSATTQYGGATEVPMAPKYFEAIALESTEIGLRWSPSISGYTYTVERQISAPTPQNPNAIAWQVVDEFTGNEGYSTIDIGLAPLTRYDYRLRVNNAAGEAPISTAFAITAADGKSGDTTGGGSTLGPWTPPAYRPDSPSNSKTDTSPLSAPANLHLVTQTYLNAVPAYKFQWNTVTSSDPQSVVVGYRIYVGKTLVGTTTQTEFEYDPRGSLDRRHTIYVVAVDAQGRESYPSNTILINFASFGYATDMTGNDAFYPQVQLRRIVKLMQPQPATKYAEYEFSMMQERNWTTLQQWNCYPFGGETATSNISFLSTRKLAGRYHLMGWDQYTFSDKGQFRFLVYSYDQRPRDVKFRWIEIFYPFTDYGANFYETTYNLNAQVLNAGEETIHIPSGQDRNTPVYGAQIHEVSAPTEFGFVKFQFFNPVFGISTQPGENVADYSYYDEHGPVFLKPSFEDDSTTPAGAKPKGNLYKLQLHPGTRTLESGRLAVDSVKLKAKDDKDEGVVKFYVHTKATDQWKEIPLGQDLRPDYFVNRDTENDYEFYVKVVKPGSATLQWEITRANHTIAENQVIVALHEAINFLTRDPDTGEVETLGGLMDLANGTPNVTLASLSSRILPSGQLEVHVQGTLRDYAEEIISDTPHTLPLSLWVLGQKVADVPTSAAPGALAASWQRHDSSRTFDAKLQIATAGIGFYTLSLKSDKNAVGRSGEARGMLHFERDWDAYRNAQGTFGAQPYIVSIKDGWSADKPAQLELTLENNQTLTLTESKDEISSGIFEGELDIENRISHIQFFIKSRPPLDASKIDTFEGNLIITLSDESPPRLMELHFEETAPDSRRFICPIGGVVPGDHVGLTLVSSSIQEKSLQIPVQPIAITVTLPNATVSMMDNDGPLQILLNGTPVKTLEVTSLDGQPNPEGHVTLQIIQNGKPRLLLPDSAAHQSASASVVESLFPESLYRDQGLHLEIINRATEECVAEAKSSFTKPYFPPASAPKVYKQLLRSGGQNSPSVSANSEEVQPDGVSIKSTSELITYLQQEDSEEDITAAPSEYTMRHVLRYYQIFYGDLGIEILKKYLAGGLQVEFGSPFWRSYSHENMRGDADLKENAIPKIILNNQRLKNPVAAATALFEALNEIKNISLLRKSMLEVNFESLIKMDFPDGAGPAQAWASATVGALKEPVGLMTDAVELGTRMFFIGDVVFTTIEVKDHLDKGEKGQAAIAIGCVAWGPVLEIKGFAKKYGKRALFRFIEDGKVFRDLAMTEDIIALIKKIPKRNATFLEKSKPFLEQLQNNPAAERDLRLLWDSVYKTTDTTRLRTALTDAGVNIPKKTKWSKWHAHHDYPVEHEFDFLQAGIDINEGPSTGRWLPDEFHLDIVHGDKSGKSFGGKWNEKWDEFFEYYKSIGKPPTVEEIGNFKTKMREATSDFEKTIKEIVWPPIP